MAIFNSYVSLPEGKYLRQGADGGIENTMIKDFTPHPYEATHPSEPQIPTTSTIPELRGKGDRVPSSSTMKIG
jgi:hypothetical protein